MFMQLALCSATRMLSATTSHILSMALCKVQVRDVFQGLLSKVLTIQLDDQSLEARISCIDRLNNGGGASLAEHGIIKAGYKTNSQEPRYSRAEELDSTHISARTALCPYGGALEELLLVAEGTNVVLPSMFAEHHIGTISVSHAPCAVH
eukprot:6470411-Amphidinium_carterae.2